MARPKVKAGRKSSRHIPNEEVRSSGELTPEPTSPPNSGGNIPLQSQDVPRKKQTGWTRFFAEVCKGLGESKYDFGHDLSEVSQLASTWWREMTADERAPYVEAAREERETFKASHSVQTQKMRLAPFRTRCSPNMVFGLKCGISNDKKKVAAIKSMGFGFVMELRCQQLPREFLFTLLEHFDQEQMILHIDGSDPIAVTEDDVHLVLGVPSGGERVPREIEKRDLELLRSQIPSMSLDKLKEHIIGGVAGPNFQQMFLLFLLGCFLCPTTKDVASPRLLAAISIASSAKKFNWAEFILDWLVTEVRKYKQKVGSMGRCTGGVGGCLFFLMILYFYRAPLGVEPKLRGSCLIGAWDDSTIRQRVQIELSSAPEKQRSRRTNQAGKGAEMMPSSETSFKNPDFQALYDSIYSDAQQMLKGFTEAVERQLRTADEKFGQSSMAPTTPFHPPASPFVTPNVHDFFQPSKNPKFPSHPSKSQQSLDQRPKRATQPGRQQQSPYIAVPEIVIPQFTAEENVV